MAITKEQIFETADQLLAAGDTPTLVRVRGALGGGSYTTISEFMGEWKAKQQAAQAPLHDPAPEAINQRLAELGAEIWAAAQGQANTRLAGERESLETTRRQMETTQQEATDLADLLSTELEAAQAQNVALEAARQEMQQQLEQLQQEQSRFTQQLATSEARAEETSKRTADLKTELEKAHTEREQAQQVTSDSREAAARLQGELTATQAQNVNLLDNLKQSTRPTNQPNLSR